MEERKCELRLPNGKVVNFSYAKLKAGIAVTALVLVGAVGGAGYLYHQLADYRSEATDYAAYKQNKAEQQTKLQKLLQDNERMLRDMAEISNLEKKLRRAVIRDVDSSKLGEGTSMLIRQRQRKRLPIRLIQARAGLLKWISTVPWRC